MEDMKYTKFERTRIIGARAMQIASGAPLLIDAKSNITDPVTLAKMEFEAKVIPITIKRQMPKRTE